VKPATQRTWVRSEPPRRGHAPLVYELDDLVLFELPVYADVDALSRRVRPRWRGWTRREDDLWLVAAEVDVDPADLATLLREVEAFVADEGLLAIRFCLDGRFHVMEARALERAA
jgi:hypothetical protein